MANNKPINRRPWRKKPWAKRRPTRWNAVTNEVNDGILLNTTVFPSPTSGGTAPIAVLVDGQIDVEPWADEQEVTLDRIVGAIHLYGYAIEPSSGANTLGPKLPLIKMGIVLNEEISADAAVPTRDLWNQEDLEDVEWLWLWSGFPDTYLSQTPLNPPTASNGIAKFAHSVYVDIKNRRKIGQMDQLALYASWAVPTADYTVEVLSYTDVRCILMSR